MNLAVISGKMDIFDELRPLVCQDSPREQLQQKLNLKYFLFTMEDMSTHSGNKLTEEQIEQLIKRLRHHQVRPK